tara:strand:+ start:576 stop:980 length:405 start_codon:yes stop_codon:yes gene_type:complete
MYETKIIFFFIILSFLLVYPLTQLHETDRSKNTNRSLPKNKLILLIIRITSVLSFICALYILFAGIYLISGWDPFTGLSSTDLSIKSLQMKGRGLIVIIFIKFLPYLMIIWSLINLFTSSMSIGFYFFHKSWTK